MLSFHYTARDPASGRVVKSTVEADSENAAAKLIKKEGLTPVEITLITASKFNFNRKGKVKAKDRVLFSRQLSTLINAGLPLIQSLQQVASQTQSKPLKVIINKVISDVEGGATLANSMAKYPQVFNNIYVSLIAAGETSGTLDKALERLAVQQEKDADLISKIRGAMMYPVIILLVMVAVVGFMLVKVLPQVQILYSGLKGAHLPLITSILLGASHFVIHFWWLMLIVLAVLVVAGTRYARTGPGKLVVDKLKMKVWPIGELFMKVYMARFSRTAATLVASGVPLIQVLDITAQSVNNVHIAKSIKSAIEKVRAGKALSDSIKGDPNFLELVPNMIHIGEQSGSLESMLGKTADYYEKEVDDEIKNISSLIEPVMMIALGIVAFIIVAAILLPVYSLAGNSNFTSSI